MNSAPRNQRPRQPASLAIFALFLVAALVIAAAWWWQKKDLQSDAAVQDRQKSGEQTVQEVRLALWNSWATEKTSSSLFPSHWQSGEWAQLTRMDQGHWQFWIPCAGDTAWLVLPAQAFPTLGIQLDSALYVQDTTRPFLLCPSCASSDSLPILAVRAENTSGPTTLYLADSSTLVFDSLVNMPKSVQGKALRFVQGVDTLWFVPRLALDSIEVIREEDGHPEGCGQMPEEMDETSEENLGE